MKKIVLILMILVMVFSMSFISGASYPEEPAAGETNEYKGPDFFVQTAVDGGSLNFRSGASTTTSVLMEIPNGVTLNIVDLMYDEYSGYLFGKTVYNDYMGWISLRQTNILSGDGYAAPDYYVRVSAEGGELNLRAGAGTGYGVMARIPNSEFLHITDLVYNYEDGYFFGKTTYMGMEGWVSVRQTRVISYQPTEDGEVPMMIMGSMQERQRIIDAKGTWETVTLGMCEQDNNIENGSEAIEWMILKRDGDLALVISKNVLDMVQYHPVDKAMTWEDSYLRNWLNGQFYQSAFTDTEKSAILDTLVTSEKNRQSYSPSDGNDTYDRIFLLSYDEVRELFVNPDDSKGAPTEYCMIHFNDMDATNYARSGCVSWWIRTMSTLAGGADIAGSVTPFGSASQEGFVNRSGSTVSLLNGLRPAMWVDLSVLNK